MIKFEKIDDSGQLEITMSGEVSAHDYETVLTPGIADALSEHDYIRLLVRCEEDLSYDPGGAWADLKLGLSHWRGFDRVAIVTQLGWVRTTVGMVAPFAPCPVKIFDPSEQEDARRWLSESLGSIHIEELNPGVLHVSLMGKLDPEIYESKNEDINVRLRGLDHFNLLLDLREFQGWAGLSSIYAHLNLIREHSGKLKKVSIVGNSSWQKVAGRIGKMIVGVDAQFFDGDHFADAVDWIKE
ncbi:MAG: STAS/SEC14 domain-containing protein [Rhizobiaceae bacterium]